MQLFFINMTVETYIDKRLHIFDYDHTLYISSTYEKRLTYKNYIINTIRDLKQKGKLIAMASHNINADKYVYREYPEIYNCFDVFVCDYPIDKKFMVSFILDHLDCKPNEAIFYDDRTYNIESVEKLGVFCYLVNKTTGIKFEDISIKNNII